VQAGDVLAFVTPPFQAITSPTCARRPASSINRSISWPNALPATSAW
jgi:hypothetical protein